MNFLALIVALVLALGWPFGPYLHRDEWFGRWRAWLHALGLEGILGTLLTIGVPVVCLQFVLDVVQPLLFGLAWIALAVASLLYAVGRGDLGEQLEQYRSHLRRDDFEGAYLHARNEMGWRESRDGQDMSPGAVHEAIQREFLYRGYEHWFAVLFYFLLLGPAGAVAYRLLQLLPREDAGVSRLLFFIDWVPARLLAAAFTVTGNFVESWDELLDSLTAPDMTAPAVLYSVAMAATGEDRRPAPENGFGVFAARQNQGLSALMRRSGVFWLVLISVSIVLV